jgi:hypothetical protein
VRGGVGRNGSPRGAGGGARDRTHVRLRLDAHHAHHAHDADHADDAYDADDSGHDDDAYNADDTDDDAVDRHRTVERKHHADEHDPGCRQRRQPDQCDGEHAPVHGL